MTRKEYGKAKSRLIDQYVASTITDATYIKCVATLRRKFEKSQQEKAKAEVNHDC